MQMQENRQMRPNTNMINAYCTTLQKLEVKFSMQSSILSVNALIIFNIIITLYVVSQQIQIQLPMKPFFLLVLLVSGCSAATVDLTSASSVVGELTTYTIVISNHNSPSILQTFFNQWSPNQQFPYRSDYVYNLVTGSSQIQLVCKLKFSRTVIECNLPFTPEPMSIRANNIYNPSSTKPYELQFNLIGSTTQNLVTTLQVSEIPTSQFVSFGYNTEVGAQSTSVSLFFNADYYLTSLTELQINYDSNVIAMTPTVANNYSIQSQSVGSFKLSTWSDLSLGTRSLVNLTIANTQAAISTTIVGTLYFNESNNIYNIQSYALNVELLPANFNSLTIANPLQFGLTQQTLALATMVCPFSAIDKSGTNISYVDIQMNLAQIPVSTCANQSSLNSTTKICSVPSNSNPLQITSITTTILNQVSTQITATLYTYNTPSDTYYPLCSGSTLATLTTQTIKSATFDINLCSTNIVGGANPNVVLVLEVDSWNADDVVHIYGMQGVVESPWVQAGSSHTFTLTNANLLNSTHLSIPIPYSNPTYIAANAISSIEISRPSLSLIYASSTTQLNVCEVSSVINLNFLTVNSTVPQTYAISNYEINFIPTLNDYTTADRMEIQFTQNPYALLAGVTASVNSINKGIATDISTGKVTIPNAFDGSPSYVIVIGGVLNPPTVCTNCSVVVSLASAISLKEQSAFILTFTAASLALVYDPLPILTTTNISVTVSNSVRSSFMSSLSSSVQVTLPFPCSNSTSATTTWPAFTQSITVRLVDCQIGYFVEDFAVLSETISSVQSTFTNQLIQLACPSNCFTCSSRTVCTECVNITHSASIYLNGGQCGTACPEKTFLAANSTSCESCHPSCLTCSDSPYTSCITCFQFFSITNGICISVCGAGKYYQGSSCQQCHVNCDYCLNASYCYQCKQSAQLVGNGLCQFTSCQYPCETCQGTNSTCTSCQDSLYLLSNVCYESCPSGYYAIQSAFTCQSINAPLLYLPVTITSIILIMLALICNRCVDQKITDNRKNIHLLTYSSAILAYMEIIAVIIVVALSTSNYLAVGYTGIAFWVLSNIFFAIYYFKVIRNEDQITSSMDKMSDRSKCIFYTTIVLSIVVTLRTYRILFCGLFKGVAPYLINFKRQSSNRKVNNDHPSNSNKNAVDDQSQESNNIRTSKFELKKPIFMYLTVFSFTGSILFLVTGILEVVFQQYTQMILWGVDLIIVVFASVIMTIFDMYVGIKRSYFLDLEQPVQVNETVENLEDHIDQKMLHEKDLSKKLPLQVSNLDANRNIQDSKRKNISPKNASRKSVSPKNESLQRKKDSQSGRNPYLKKNPKNSLKDGNQHGKNPHIKKVNSKGGNQYGRNPNLKRAASKDGNEYDNDPQWDAENDGNEYGRNPRRTSKDGKQLGRNTQWGSSKGGKKYGRNHGVSPKDGNGNQYGNYLEQGAEDDGSDYGRNPQRGSSKDGNQHGRNPQMFRASSKDGGQNARRSRGKQKKSKSPMNNSDSSDQQKDKNRGKKKGSLANRHSALVKSRPPYKARYDTDEGLPDVKVFDDDELCADEQLVKAQKLKRITKPSRRFQGSMGNIKQPHPNIRKSTTNLGWNVNDIFLGFLKEKDDFSGDEQQTQNVFFKESEKAEELGEQSKSANSFAQNLKNQSQKSEVKIQDIENDEEPQSVIKKQPTKDVKKEPENEEN